ncbi:cold shock domain-containing protein [Parahaliea sp. F7430]|uniref:Cold shock domain-containing protein n=1 Tax=Sediminihaliea albiluteola TaxID=2758564 RepID=A0A7W2YJR9_9GAMM|nr:cold shock domain-containing protein [Sediminihaliea albiluteola]
MNLSGKLVISLIVAAVASTSATLIQGGSIPDLTLIASFCVATLATAWLVSIPTAKSSTAVQGERQDSKRSSTTALSSANREDGTVKWFNVSKGFGFITKDDGEEIFVHFRSIRGEGRRSLRDGQRVTFEVADSEKGPQAEDVEALD